MWINFHSAKKSMVSSLIPVLLILQFNLPFAGTLNAGPQDEPPQQLQQAQKFYIKRQFDKTIELVHLYLKNNDPGNQEKLQAYTLLAKTFIAKNKPDTAKELVRKILEIEPEYRPTLEQEKPSYVRLVDSVRSEYQPKVAATQSKKPFFQVNWIWVGSGATAAAVVGAMILSKDNNEKSEALPKPPPLPR